MTTPATLPEAFSLLGFTPAPPRRTGDALIWARGSVRVHVPAGLSDVPPECAPLAWALDLIIAAVLSQGIEHHRATLRDHLAAFVTDCGFTVKTH